MEEAIAGKVVVRRIRVYGSNNTYQVEGHNHQPTVLENCPMVGATTAIYSGELPQLVKSAELARRAQANYRLLLECTPDLLDEHEKANPELGIQASMKRVSQADLFYQRPHAWWTTFVVECVAEIGSTAELADIERRLIEDTESFLNVGIARLALVQGQSFYSEMLMDRVFFYLPKRTPLVIPRITTFGTLSGRFPSEHFPAETMASLAAIDQVLQKTLAVPCKWYLEAVRDPDHFKALFWAFFAMETLINGLEKHIQALEKLGDNAKLQVDVRTLIERCGVSEKISILIRKPHS